MKKEITIILSLVVLCIILLSGCGIKHPSRGHGINVTSSVNFYGDAAKAVLGKYGTVHAIINNDGMDPHDFQSTPATAERIAKSDDVVSNGMGYDTWINKMINNSNAKAINVQTLMHKSNNDNPHLWYQDRTMEKLVQTLEKQFAKQDPKHRKIFQKNAQNYIGHLRVISKEIQHLKQHRHNSKVDVSEPVFDYALHAMGYQINDSGFAKAIEDGSDPTPEEIHHLQNDIINHRIAFLVQNTQTHDKIVTRLVSLAHQHHVPIVNVTETMPDGSNYQQWMLGQYQQVARIQRMEIK